jgi:HEAT repeat protein
LAASADQDEVLRFIAVQAAAELEGNAGQPTLIRSAGDPDPRVRRAAFTGLGRNPDADSARRLTLALAGDEWPMVRRSAAESLGGVCSHGFVREVATALARAVIGDGDPEARSADVSEEVRRASLVALVRCAPSSPAVDLALKSHAQPLAVRELAAAQLAAHGGPVAARTLAAAITDILADPAADERSAALVVACLRGLARVGDRSQPVLDAIGSAAVEPLSSAVRSAAMEVVGKLCPEGAGEVLARAANDPDGYVRRAAANARLKCRR